MYEARQQLIDELTLRADGPEAQRLTNQCQMLGLGPKTVGTDVASQYMTWFICGLTTSDPNLGAFRSKVK